MRRLEESISWEGVLLTLRESSRPLGRPER